MPSVQIHQSFYGDKSNAYALLKTSLPDKKLAQQICNSTDLADRPGPGITWQPVIRGFSSGEYYLLLKTYPDVGPNIRSGRVYSHVLMIEKKDLAFINNLATLINLFSPVIDKEASADPILYVDHLAKPPLAANKSRYRKAASGILNGQKVIWIGQEGFEGLITVTWNNLWAETRFDLQFGISFSPDILTDAATHLLCTPDALANKWNNLAFCVVNRNEDIVTGPQSIDYLTGKIEAQDLHNFITRLDKMPTSVRQLGVLERGLGTYKNLQTSTDFNDIFNLYKILEVSGDTNLLPEVFGRLIEIIPGVESQSINALRKLEPHPQTKSKFKDLEEVVSRWLTTSLFDPAVNAKQDISKLIVNTLKEDSEKWWVKCVRLALKDLLKTNGLSSAKVLWIWLMADTDNVISAIGGGFLAEQKDIETGLVDTFPASIAEASSERLVLYAKKHKLYLLHARLLVSLFPVQKAIQAQLEIDQQPASMAPLQLIADLVKHADFVASACSSSEERLHVLAGVLIRKNKKLLSTCDITAAGWQAVLMHALNEEYQLNDLFKKPAEQVTFIILDEIIKGRPVLPELLSYIADSSYTDLSLYNKRSEVWSILPAEVKNKFLQSTALSLIKRPDFLDEDWEQELQEAITSEQIISAFLHKNQRTISPVIRLFSKYPSLPQKHLQNYLHYFDTSLPAIDAKKLGILVFNYTWRNCLGIIQDKAKRNNSFKTAFQECYQLLDLPSIAWAAWQGLITNVQINQNDWWQSFEDLACYLYPAGPTDKHVWKKSGGAEADLLRGSTGKETWHDALQGIRNGAFDEPTLESLFARMTKDFRKNDDLKMLIKLKQQL